MAFFNQWVPDHKELSGLPLVRRILLQESAENLPRLPCFVSALRLCLGPNGGRPSYYAIPIQSFCQLGVSGSTPGAGGFFRLPNTSCFGSHLMCGQSRSRAVSRCLGKQATIFVARRAKPHPRTIEAAQLGAKIVAVAPGYLSVVQARAREYCTQTGARLMPFGADMPGAINAIAAAARAIGIEPEPPRGRTKPARAAWWCSLD
jgi:hypothetical protein